MVKANQNLNLTPHQSKHGTGQAARPPVVVVLGHIDHGKTTLLDFIRKTKVAEKESGGITQHVGAYEIEVGNPPSPKATEGQRKITFIDTPGHEAFSQIRSRGAKVADIAILVIDATEGIKPQTKEAILHVKKAGIPLIVAINKIDKPEAQPEKIKRELVKEGVLVESMGGKIPTVEVSAKTGQGVPNLMELILLVAEMENLKADVSKPGQGIIIECCLTSQRGTMVTLILNEGKLKPGQIIGTPSAFGKIKILENFRGEKISEAFPSQPVLVLGFEEVPKVGEEFKVFASIEEAKANIKTKEKSVPEIINAGEGRKVLNLILKADVLGSLEAIEGILKNLLQEKPSTRAEHGAGLVPYRNEVSGTGVILRILKSDVGEVTETDVKLARQSKAKILSFRVKANPTAETLAEREKIRIMQFDLIYDLVEGVRKYMERLFEPETVRTDLGKIKTLVIFLTDKNRQIVGGRVIEGQVKKGTSIEIIREEEVKGRGKMINLQRNKKDIEQASKGEEVGILYEGNEKIEKDDLLVIYTEEKKKVGL